MILDFIVQKQMGEEPMLRMNIGPTVQLEMPIQLQKILLGKVGKIFPFHSIGNGKYFFPVSYWILTRMKMEAVRNLSLCLPQQEKKKQLQEGLD